MQGYQIKSKFFSEIMDNYFPEWKPVRSSKTKRISPSGVSIPVKLYYEREEKKEKLQLCLRPNLANEMSFSRSNATCFPRTIVIG